MSEQQTETPKAQQKATEYVVLKEVPELYESSDGGESGEKIEAWTPIGSATAKNKNDAIKEATQGEDGTHADGKYKAIPASSWKGGVVIDTAPRSLFKGLDGASAESAEGDGDGS